MKIRGLKIFVTGGAGFIGSHIVEELLARQASVTVYDNFSSGHIENLSHLSKDINIVKGDILNFESLKKAMRKHHVVSHHAAQLEIFLSIENPDRDLKINTIGTLNVLRAAKINGVIKVINASSACIYGQMHDKTNENFLPLPNWPYGVTKLAAERYAAIYSRYYNFPVVNLRYAITYGEREWFRRAIPIFIKRAILGKPLVVFSNGQQIRDFIYVKDAVRLHNICIENDTANYQSYNVATGIPTKVIELAHMICDVAEEIFGARPAVIHERVGEGEFSKIVKDKKRNPAELKVMWLDPSKAFKELNWQAEVSLREGLKREMLWAIDNLRRWKRIRYTKIKK